MRGIEHTCTIPQVMPEDSNSEIAMSEFSLPSEHLSPTQLIRISSKIHANSPFIQPIYSPKRVRVDKEVKVSTLNLKKEKHEERNNNIQLAKDLIILKNLFNKYEKKIQETYNSNVISDIMMNSRTHIVITFKDLLIYNRTKENVKRCYKPLESWHRIKRYANHNKGRIIQPNYFAIEERKFIIKNVQEKKRVVREQYKAKLYPKKNTPDIIEEMIKRINSIPEEQIAKMDIIDILDKYIDRDSLSLLGKSSYANLNLTLTPANKECNKKIVVGKISKPLIKQKENGRPLNFVFLTKTINKPKTRHQSQEHILKLKGRSNENEYYAIKDKPSYMKSAGSINEIRTTTPQIVLTSMKALPRLKINTESAVSTTSMSSVTVSNKSKVSPKVPLEISKLIKVKLGSKRLVAENSIRRLLGFTKSSAGSGVSKGKGSRLIRVVSPQVKCNKVPKPEKQRTNSGLVISSRRVKPTVN